VPDVRCSAFLVSELPAVPAASLFFADALADALAGEPDDAGGAAAVPAPSLAACAGGSVSLADCAGGAVSVVVGADAGVAAFSDAAVECSLPVDDGSATAPPATPKLTTTVSAAMRTAGERNGLLDARVMMKTFFPPAPMETGIEKPS
jgi:hypothetical protein